MALNLAKVVELERLMAAKPGETIEPWQIAHLAAKAINALPELLATWRALRTIAAGQIVGQVADKVLTYDLPADEARSIAMEALGWKTNKQEARHVDS